jgi:hypothetical protein
LPDEQLAQLDPTDFVLPPSPLLRAEKTDMMRRMRPRPQLGHFKPLPLLPTWQRRSVIASHFSHLNSYSGIVNALHLNHTQAQANYSTGTSPVSTQAGRRVIA